MKLYKVCCKVDVKLNDYMLKLIYAKEPLIAVVRYEEFLVLWIMVKCLYFVLMFNFSLNCLVWLLKRDNFVGDFFISMVRITIMEKPIAKIFGRFLEKGNVFLRAQCAQITHGTWIA